jgi:hypothetical protein
MNAPQTMPPPSRDPLAVLPAGALRVGLASLAGSARGQRLAAAMYPLSHLVLVRRERPENLFLLSRGHVEGVQGARELGCNFIELRRRDPEMAVGFFEAEHSAPRLRRGELERPSRDIADP